ncbi:hypothetical protein KCP70_11005 [Salmonella enterica subsp. enterica]|nr:hypothetical protein KCP70_11005 [Salmonella enterica subsp. enterica]
MTIRRLLLQSGCPSAVAGCGATVDDGSQNGLWRNCEARNAALPSGTALTGPTGVGGRRLPLSGITHQKSKVVRKFDDAREEEGLAKARSRQ